MKGKNNIIGFEIIKIMRARVHIVTEMLVGLTHNSIF
jgi:hypothetical protein